MTELGNVFSESTAPPDRARGPDLEARVEVSRADLGRRQGVVVRVPLELPVGEQRLPRAVSLHDEGDAIILHLPEQLPDGAVITLRGQGGQREGGVPGDLRLEIRLVGPRRGLVRPAVISVGITVTLLLSALAAWLTLGL